MHIRFEEGEERKPNLSTSLVALKEVLVVGLPVVIKEETRGDVDGNKDVDGIVLVGR